MADPTRDSSLIALIGRIPVFSNMQSITSLGGGLTNQNYRIDTAAKSFVMRVSSNTSRVLGIDRENERENTARAHEAGVGAAVIDSLPDENVLVISWINGKTLHAGDIHKDPQLIIRLAAALRSLHNGPAFKGEFYFPAVRKKYLDTVMDNNYFLPDEYLSYEPLVDSLEKIIADTPEGFVPCNNDLLAENFIDDGKKIWIIDYEYAGQNEASFDIGNLANEIFLSDAELTVLCDAYWKKHLPGKINRAKAWSIIARYGWVLWASIQEAVSPIHFDFRSWGLKKWNSVLQDLQDDRYTAVLRNLKDTNK
jgi:thiamine kinase-like enzyme